jgi:ElaB/YqjD/DUF883 family membrane-anchored ribosome-binding protein
MNAIEKTERQLNHEKKRLKDAGEQILGWLEKTPPNQLARENPWLLAGITAAVAGGIGYLVGQWFASRRDD